MNIRSISIGYGLTWNLPDDESVHPSITLVADVEEAVSDESVIEALTARTQAYVQGVVDDALEERGLEPHFYDGTLYRVQDWLQRRAIVVMPTTVNGRDLPGEWRTAIPGRSRLHTASARAGRLLERGNFYRERIVLEDGNLEEIHRWWGQRAWYRIYGIFTRRGCFRPRFGDQVLIVLSTGIRLPDEPAILWLAEQFEDVPAYELELGAAVSAVDDVFDRWTVCRTQAELDKAICDWTEQETRW